tara:strand:- start:1691 stop:2515 length:825 start_codon:yes stop_codon:yes gene_type:complete
MLHIYSFCVYIEKHSMEDLLKVLKLFIKSLDINVKKYKLILYTNFIEEINHNNVEIRKYYDKTKNRYDNNWFNLNFNRINIYKDLYDEYKIDFLWMDIDSIITYDISYLNNIDNIFLENGGNEIVEQKIFKNSFETVKTNIHIQGNLWKLNIELYNDLLLCLNMLDNENKILDYDVQSLFNFYIHKYDKKQIKNLNIYGDNYYNNTLNGLAQWNIDKITHSSIDGLEKMYYENNILKTKYDISKEIHIVSFTFETLKKLYDTNLFKNIFGKYII